jgi:hypothetical protein
VKEQIFGGERILKKRFRNTDAEIETRRIEGCKKKG